MIMMYQKLNDIVERKNATLKNQTYFYPIAKKNPIELDRGFFVDIVILIMLNKNIKRQKSTQTRQEIFYQKNSR